MAVVMKLLVAVTVWWDWWQGLREIIDDDGGDEDDVPMVLEIT